MNTVTLTSLQQAIMAAAIDTGGPLDALTLRLFVNPGVIPTRNSAIADLTEASYAGYTAQAAVTWLGPYIGTDAMVHVAVAGHLFESTDGVTPNTVYGWYLTNAGGTVLTMLALLPVPVPLTAAGDGVVIAPDLTYGQ